MAPVHDHPKKRQRLHRATDAAWNGSSLPVTLDHPAVNLAGPNAVRAKGNPLCVGLDPRWESLPEGLRAKHGTNQAGRRIHYYLNYSGDAASFPYTYASGRDLLTGKASNSGDKLTLSPWDLAILEESK